MLVRTGVDTTPSEGVGSIPGARVGSGEGDEVTTSRVGLAISDGNVSDVVEVQARIAKRISDANI